MRIEIEDAKRIAYPLGIEIGVKGFQSDPSCDPSEPTQIYIELYEGKLHVHVWDGSSEDPQTIKIDAAAQSQPEVKP